MGQKNLQTLIFLLLLSLLFSFSLFSLAEEPISSSKAAVCSATRNPDFCNSVLPPSKLGDNLYYYSRFSIGRSLSQARKFSRKIKKLLSKRVSLSLTAVRALQDCDLLSDLNVDFLLATAAAVNASGTLLDPQAEQAQTLLSALLTNQETCMEGLQLASATWSLRKELALPLSNNTKLFSLSLSLFSRAWVHKKKKSNFGAKDLSFTMSSLNREIFELAAAGRQRFLQAPSPPPASQLFVKTVVVVSKGQNGNFTTIGAAVAAAPNNTKANSGYYLIYVTAGVYEEYVEVPKNKRYVIMVGDGIGQTIITGNRSVADGWTTFNSATFAVVGQGFVGVNMTFRNTAGTIKGQAVAVRNGADRSAFYQCSFEGYQDTLYAHSLRQFYRQCDIYGTVDFIFGNAAAVFQQCNMYARIPINSQSIVVTAQGRTDPAQNTGMSIQGCKILAAPDLMKSGSRVKTFLGRPWMNYSRTIVMESFLDKLVDPRGWTLWNGSFALSTLYYAEFNNSGPASGTASRVNWPGYHVINATDALNFTVANFIDGGTWLPTTGVPYSAGLT